MTLKVLRLQSSEFNTDKSNRLGFHKLHRSLSSKMWNNGKDLGPILRNSISAET
jgi:hypothetical protein